MKFSLFLVAPLLLFLTAVELCAQTKILFIGKEPDHPYGSHMYMHTGNLLAVCLKLTEGVETVVSQGWPRDEQQLKSVGAIVVYATPAAELLLDSPYRNQVDQMMKSGVGLATIHWASSVREHNLKRLGPKWLETMGGTWVSNVGYDMGKSQLTQLVPDHPICRGWKPFKLHDEFYRTPTISDEAVSLLQVTSKTTPTVVGWAFERPGGGRSFGTTLGHFYSNFQHDAFRRMIVNGILWTASKEIPLEGAPVSVNEAALSLPPAPE